MNKRNVAIDVARGLALFFVVLGHLVTVKSKTFTWIFSFHMPLFFFLSGMCFNIDKYSNFFEFLKEKVKKRIVPYFGFVLVGIVICLLIPAWRAGLFSINVLKEIFYNAQPEKLHIGQIWFLVALFFAEIILYAINKMFGKFKRNKYLIIATYVILALIGANILDIAKAINIKKIPFKIDTAITACVFMGIGYEVNKIKLFEMIEHYKLCFAILFLWIGFVPGQINEYVNICICEYGNIILYYISALFGIAGIYLISEKIKENKLLQFYGKNSLFMFAIHSFLVFLFTHILSIIYNRPIQMLKNVPFNLCIIGSIIIYLLLLPITIIYNKIKKKLTKQKILYIESNN